MVHPHPEPEYDSPFSMLRRYIVRGREVRNAAREQCELCATPIPEEHRHMLEVAAREVRCVCRPCALLFEREAASRGRYRLVPERRIHLSGFQLADETWAKLGIPVGLAYLVRDTPSEQLLAWYPGPAGAIDAEVAASCWDEVRTQNPTLDTLEPDVEALLVHRVRDARDYFLVPIDDCFSLVGLIRRHWRGLTGGGEVWSEVSRYFEGLKQRALPITR